MRKLHQTLQLTDQEWDLLYSGTGKDALPAELIRRLEQTSEGLEILEMVRMIERMDLENESTPVLQEESVERCWASVCEFIQEEDRIRDFHCTYTWGDRFQIFRGWWLTALSLLPEALSFTSREMHQKISEPDPRLLGSGYPMTEEQKRSLEKIMLDLGYIGDWERRRKMVRQLRLGFAAAAIVITAVGIGIGSQIYGRHLQQEIARVQQDLDALTQTGGVYELTEVGTISLLPDTRLKVRGMRELELRAGNAWFDIIPAGRGFSVDTASGDIHVTGTSFGVSGHQNEFKLDVIEGSVELRSENNKWTVLAGAMAFIKPSGINIDGVGDWGTMRPYWVKAVNDPTYDVPRGVIPYQPDPQTPLLLHFEEPVGTLAAEVKDHRANEHLTHLVRNDSPLGQPLEIIPTTISPDDSPYKGLNSVPGLGRAVTLKGEHAPPGAFIPMAGERKLNLKTDVELNVPNSDGRRIYRNSEKGLGFNDRIFNTDTFTIEAWIRNEKGHFAGKEPMILHLRDRYLAMDESRFINFGLTTARQGRHELFLAYSTGPTDYAAYSSRDSIQFESGKWYHVAVTFEKGPAFNNNSIRFYVDPEDRLGNPHRRGTPFGQLIYDAPEIAPFNGGKDGAVEIGGSFHDDSNSLNGSIDEVRYSNVIRDRFNLNSDPVQLIADVSAQTAAGPATPASDDE